MDEDNVPWLPPDDSYDQPLPGFQVTRWINSHDFIIIAAQFIRPGGEIGGAPAV
jgi:hypothetical protein